MTIRELQARVWSELPFLRRHIVGRDRVDDLVSLSIEQAPVDLLKHVSGNPTSQQVVLAAWGQSVKRSYCLIRGSTDEKQLGPIFWILIGPLLQALLSRLMDWYFRSPKNSALMRGWQRRMSGDK